MEEDDDQPSDDPPPDIHVFVSCEYDNDPEWQLLYDVWMDLRWRAYYPHIQTRATQMLKDYITGEDVLLLSAFSECRTPLELRPPWAIPQPSSLGQLLKAI